uniref:Uncharacterized protein n=1 Tax=Kalanchoe fedtschenkoi TaxID=63787 RepID=A0A7N0RI64_KALFE
MAAILHFSSVMPRSQQLKRHLGVCSFFSCRYWCLLCLVRPRISAESLANLHSHDRYIIVLFLKDISLGLNTSNSHFSKRIIFGWVKNPLHHRCLP